MSKGSILIHRVTVPQRNNFDLLRFVFATVVLLVHAFVLSSNAKLAWINQVLSSEMAVHAFFVVSGFLIFMSYENTQELARYFEKRLRRIYPAYFSVVILCALLGVLLSSMPVSDYIASPELYRYLAANLVFLNFVHPDLPGVFTSNTFTVVNGALWTLKIEVLFYLSVPLLVLLFRRVGYVRGIVLTYAASFIYYLVVGELVRQHGGVYVELQRQLPGQMMYFIAGALLFYFYHEFTRHANRLLICALLALLLGRFLVINPVEPMALAIVVVYLACAFPYLGNFGKYGDFSYGIYIIHFPVLQALVMFGGFREQPWLALAVTIGLVMVSAIMMWNWVEKPFLRRTSHYIVVNR